MNNEAILKSTIETVTAESDSITFDIDIVHKTKWQRITKYFRKKEKKRSFEIKPLTLNQLYRISKLLIGIDLKDFSSTGVLNLMINHSKTCAEVIAISVTESRQKPTKELIDLFFYNLSKKDIELALTIVLKQMHALDFINTIVSIRNLNVLEMKKTVSAKDAEKNEMSPTVPGDLSVAS